MNPPGVHTDTDHTPVDAIRKGINRQEKGTGAFTSQVSERKRYLVGW